MCYRRAIQLSGGSLTMESNLARSLALSGRRAEGESLLSDLEARGLSPYRIATIEAALGRTERALTALDRGACERDPWMVWMDVDPMLDALRGQGPLNAIAARLRGTL